MQDHMSRNDDPNDYVVHDPLLEKGKEKFNRMQAKQKRREREWAGRPLTWSHLCQQSQARKNWKTEWNWRVGSYANLTLLCSLTATSLLRIMQEKFQAWGAKCKMMPGKKMQQSCVSSLVFFGFAHFFLVHVNRVYKNVHIYPERVNVAVV